MGTGTSAIEVHPLTPSRWPDLEALFNARGCGQARWCWCMYYRRSASDTQLAKGVTRGEVNRAALRSIVDARRVPGLIGYRVREPVGWVSLGPREEYPKVE